MKRIRALERLRGQGRRHARRVAYRLEVETAYRLNGIEAALELVHARNRPVRCPACHGEGFTVTPMEEYTQTLLPDGTTTPAKVRTVQVEMQCMTCIGRGCLRPRFMHWRKVDASAFFNVLGAPSRILRYFSIDER